jgi:hypothetical protein
VEIAWAVVRNVVVWGLYLVAFQMDGVGKLKK